MTTFGGYLPNPNNFSILPEVELRAEVFQEYNPKVDFGQCGSVCDWVETTQPSR